MVQDKASRSRFSNLNEQDEIIKYNKPMEPFNCQFALLDYGNIEKCMVTIEKFNQIITVNTLSTSDKVESKYEIKSLAEK